MFSEFGKCWEINQMSFNKGLGTKSQTLTPSALNFFHLTALHPFFPLSSTALLSFCLKGFLLNQHVLRLNEGKHTLSPFLWVPVALQHEEGRWGLEVAVTSFLVYATCSKFATKCLSSVELTAEKWGLSEPWPGCHEMTGIIGIHFKQPCTILLKCHIPTLKQTRRIPLW